MWFSLLLSCCFTKQYHFISRRVLISVILVNVNPVALLPHSHFSLPQELQVKEGEKKNTQENFWETGEAYTNPFKKLFKLIQVVLGSLLLTLGDQDFDEAFKKGDGDLSSSLSTLLELVLLLPSSSDPHPAARGR